MLDLKALLTKILQRLVNIGTVYTASTITNITNTSVDSPTNGASLTLPAGTYILLGEWHFNTRTTTGTTNSQIAFRNGASGGVYAMVRVFASGNNWNSLKTSCVQVFSQRTTVYLCGSTSRPTTSTTGATNWFHAIRIK